MRVVPGYIMEKGLFHFERENLPVTKAQRFQGLCAKTSCFRAFVVNGLGFPIIPGRAGKGLRVIPIQL
jgi:hypothetical protein